MKIIKEEVNKKECNKIIARRPEHPPNMGFSENWMNNSCAFSWHGCIMQAQEKIFFFIFFKQLEEYIVWISFQEMNSHFMWQHHSVMKMPLV